jgi:hypothetical protein
MSASQFETLVRTERFLDSQLGERIGYHCCGGPKVVAESGGVLVLGAEKQLIGYLPSRSVENRLTAEKHGLRGRRHVAKLWQALDPPLSLSRHEKPAYPGYQQTPRRIPGTKQSAIAFGAWVPER